MNTVRGDVAATIGWLDTLCYYLLLILVKPGSQYDVRTTQHKDISQKHKDRLGFYSCVASSTSEQLELSALVCPINFIFIDTNTSLMLSYIIL